MFKTDDGIMMFKNREDEDYAHKALMIALEQFLRNNEPSSEYPTPLSDFMEWVKNELWPKDGSKPFSQFEFISEEFGELSEAVRNWKR